MTAISYKLKLDIKNLPSLKNLSLYFVGTINEDFITSIWNQVPYIQELCLLGELLYFNLDNFVNLRVLSLCYSGKINESFNFEIFKNLCNQLEVIKISYYSKDQNVLFKLFDGYNFPYLVDLTITFLYMIRLKREFINRLPKSRKLNLTKCKIELIESDSFSNMQQITWLNLSYNQIEFIEKNAFSNLKNLKKLDLKFNKLTKFDRKFIGLGNSVEVNIEYNDFNS